MEMPTKEELKTKYSIDNDDFKVLTELPSENEAKEGGFLVKVAEAVGFQTWMWRDWRGVVLAIILLPPALQDVYTFWTPKAIYTYQQFYTYFDKHRPSPSKSDSWIAFVPEKYALPLMPVSPV